MPYTGPEPARRPLSSDDITDGIISTADLADSAVTTAKIGDATITALSSVMSSTATAAAQRAALGLDTGDDVDFNSLSLQGYKLNLFIFQIANSGGTIKHQFRTTDLSALPEHVLGINGASSTLTNTPTGTDSSTAFDAGAKIGSGDTSAVWLDTADLTAPADAMALVVISYNDSTVDYVAMPYLASVNINGATRARLSIRLINPTTGAAVAWSTALGAAKTIRISAIAMLPDYA
jgi:hypothetical protein